MADDCFLPLIHQLIEQGNGPAAVVTGSRGGQITVVRLWATGWRGPTVVLNGGCLPVRDARTGNLPDGVPLGLICG